MSSANKVEPTRDRPRRVVIEGVTPAVDGGRFAVKRVVGERVVVEADIFADGADVLAAAVVYRGGQDEGWSASPMTLLGNDHWRGEFIVTDIGRSCFSIEGWPDPFATWQRDLHKRLDAEQDVHLDLLIGANIVREAAGRASATDADRLREYAYTLAAAKAGEVESLAFDEEMMALVSRYRDETRVTRYEPDLPVVVDRERARFSAWYELFPRSTAPRSGRPGTFADVVKRLPYVADMGFDVLYLPPIHPIGRTARKGKNNAVEGGPGDPGSPWAIGSEAGGHKAVNPDLGTLDDFRRLVAAARRLGIDVALDIAFQCSPDHPYVTEHPEWFRARPNGSIQYAENPPKKYQDIYPFDFDTEDWRGLWAELKSVFEHWIEQGVRVFRVDNPHTKALAFWEWAIDDLKAAYPDVIFLAEAFTRPRVMQRLAKLGFTQSYTYFTWRNTKWELQEYLTELTRTNVREYFRPNFWPNTPDILHETLQVGGLPAFIARFVLAATLAASYGIYGPAFELGENVAREPGSEEYLNSEKYEVRVWDLDAPGSVKDVIRRVNQTRRACLALQSNDSLQFHAIDSGQLIAFSKSSDVDGSVVLVVVNLDPRWRQSGWLELSPSQLGLSDNALFVVRDALTGAAYTWRGERHYVELDPAKTPAHVFVIETGATRGKG